MKYLLLLICCVKLITASEERKNVIAVHPIGAAVSAAFLMPYDLGYQYSLSYIRLVTDETHLVFDVNIGLDDDKGHDTYYQYVNFGYRRRVSFFYLQPTLSVRHDDGYEYSKSASVGAVKVDHEVAVNALVSIGYLQESGRWYGYGDIGLGKGVTVNSGKFHTPFDVNVGVGYTF